MFVYWDSVFTVALETTSTVEVRLSRVEVPAMPNRPATTYDPLGYATAEPATMPLSDWTTVTANAPGSSA